MKFNYGVTGSVSSFTVGLYYSADGIYDPSDVQVSSMTVSPGSSTSGSGTFEASEKTGFAPDPARPYLIVVADPANAIAESNETNNTSNKLIRPDVTLTANATTVTLMDNSFFSSTDNAGTPGTFSLEGGRAGGFKWVSLPGSGSPIKYTERLAGVFAFRSIEKVGSMTFLSNVVFVTVQFPTYAKISADATVKTQALATWNAVLAYATANVNAPDASGNYPNAMRAEMGYWITLDTSTGKYGKTATITGTPVSSLQTGEVGIGSRPSDQYSDSYFFTPNLGETAVYAVASFHTHTPVTYRLPAGNSRGLGPSKADTRIDKSDDVVGLVYDYSPSAAGRKSVSFGYPLNSPAQLYDSQGTVRRKTP